MLVVPCDDASYLAFELCLVLGYCSEPQDVLERSMESLHNSNAAGLTDGTKPRLDVLGFAPNVFEVLALELGPLVNNQVLGTHFLSGNDAFQRGRYFLRCRSTLKHRKSHGPS